MVTTRKSLSTTKAFELLETVASDRFFSPAVLQPHQTGSWTESLAPALGLADGAAHVGFAHDDEGVSVTANVFTTLIGQDVTAALVDDSTGSTLTSATHG
ncbi:hypothetical protein Pth03_73920 [Planotetraspora thailandica]|uniref:Uncharacterized protein n=1 Tax=Planotetraspora thailandica TaxID=487172 RepID=A0A8J3Y182_9ACTN|nr:hypothetical protein [Planotetraspora thailandica]GII59003.1 hypothetical protein Pth03_73920 [Planotetraspora thailandica]